MSESRHPVGRVSFGGSDIENVAAALKLAAGMSGKPVSTSDIRNALVRANVQALDDTVDRVRELLG